MDNGVSVWDDLLLAKQTAGVLIGGMKTIFVLFDSLNRHTLPPYGSTVIAPNFERLAQRTVTFDNAYVCSMPCMPARRDMHTGRPNFLHRSWGPLEPFDDSMPAMLKEAGVYTHLISDHFHYWEEGGANYHTKYNSWECIRGQQGDPWIAQVRDPEPIDGPALREEALTLPGGSVRQDTVNRQVMREPEQWPMSQVFSQAEKFLERNHGEDNWFLQIEAFDPHEPFFVPAATGNFIPNISTNTTAVIWTGHPIAGSRIPRRKSNTSAIPTPRWCRCAMKSWAICWTGWTATRCGTIPN